MAGFSFALGVFVFASFLTKSSMATSLPLDPAFIPITQCCPVGSSLAIEDWQDSRQQPDGTWKDLLDPIAETVPRPTGKIAALKMLRSGERGWRPDRDEWSEGLKWDYGRHNFINRVSCVPDKNNLPNIHSLPASLYPRPPFPPSHKERQIFETNPWPLAENVTLLSEGVKFPLCPGGPDELATIVLGDGFSSGVIRGYWMSTFLRLREDGRLVGQFLDVTGTSEGLRLGVRLPRRYKYYNNTILPLPRSQETAIDADFCLTWSTDPRTELTVQGSVPLLEAVYCDPCKASVSCSLMTTVFWRQVQPYFHLELYGSISSPPGFEESSTFRSRDDLVDPRDYPKWAPPRFAFLPYLDENRDGKVTIQEFYDLKFVKIMRHVFDGLDADGDGVVQKDEANLMSFLRVSPVRKFSRELFDLMDINKDGYLSREDSRPLEDQDDLGGGRWEGSVCQFLPSWMHRPCNSLIYTGPPTYYNPLIDKDLDARISLSEFQDPWVRTLQFFVVAPNKELNVRELVRRLEQLGEPSNVVEALVQRLTPVLGTFPRMILLSMVESADKSANGAMEWEEFRGFGDFDLVADKWPKMWETLQTEMLAGLWTGGSGSDKTRCAPSSSDLLRYFKSRAVIVRLFHNLFHHQDFLFPSWVAGDIEIDVDSDTLISEGENPEE